MPAIFDPINFVSILMLTFSLFLLLTGAFTAYFGSGKSRKIGAGLLVGGLLLAILWLTIIAGPDDMSLLKKVPLKDLVIEAIGYLVAAIIGAVAAIGLFLLAIMKS